jgi:hypothetical protein
MIHKFFLKLRKNQICLRNIILLKNRSMEPHRQCGFETNPSFFADIDYTVTL